MKRVVAVNINIGEKPRKPEVSITSDRFLEVFSEAMSEEVDDFVNIVLENEDKETVRFMVEVLAKIGAHVAKRCVEKLFEESEEK